MGDAEQFTVVNQQARIHSSVKWCERSRRFVGRLRMATESGDVYLDRRKRFRSESEASEWIASHSSENCGVPVGFRTTGVPALREELQRVWVSLTSAGDAITAMREGIRRAIAETRGRVDDYYEDELERRVAVARDQLEQAAAAMNRHCRTIGIVKPLELEDRPEIVFAPQTFGLPCVYFLVASGAVVYVGKAKNGPWGRVDAHLRDKSFESVWVLPLIDHNDRELENIEASWIQKLNPKYNKSPGRRLA